jgi:hypothetical protein
MNLWIRPGALYCLTAVFLGVTANGIAQEGGVTATALPPICSGGAACSDPPVTIAAMRVPGNGLAQVGVVSTGGMAFGLEDSADVVKNQPYQAQAVTEIKQTLANGSHIAQTTTASVARDSDGRTVRIQKLSTIGPWKSSSDTSQGNPPTLTTIFDPVAQTHTDYTSDSKVAHVLPLPKPLAGATAGSLSSFAMVGPGPGAAGTGPMTFAVQGHIDSAKTGVNLSAKTESLGNKTIEGVPVTGTKTTNTIPMGMIGNDRDIVTTRETWYSPDLKLVIQSTQDDPRFGETTYSLTNIQQSDPNPTLFQIPAGYTIDKVPVVIRSN